MTWRCAGCGAVAGERVLFCPRCEGNVYVPDVARSHDRIPDTAVLTARALIGSDVRRLAIGPWAALLGDLPDGTWSALFHGEPGAGKSVAALKLCMQLERTAPVFYASFEEGHGAAFVEKLRLVEAISDRLHVGCINDLIRLMRAVQDVGARFVVFDSITHAYLQPSDVARFQRETGTALVLVSHTSKDGTVKGPTSWPHMVDVVVRFTRQGFAVTEKSRYGATVGKEVAVP